MPPSTAHTGFLSWWGRVVHHVVSPFFSKALSPRSLSHELAWDQEVLRICRPRHTVIALSADASLPQILELYTAHGHRFLPVYQGEMDHIIGCLDLCELLTFCQTSAPSILQPWTSLIAPPKSIPASATLMHAIQPLMQDSAPLMVVDEYGSMVGLLHQRDVLQHLLPPGAPPLLRLHHRDHQVKILSPSSLELSGETALVVVDDCLPEQYELSQLNDDCQSVGGLVSFYARSVPESGFTVTLPNGLRATVLASTPRKILRLRLDFDAH